MNTCWRERINIKRCQHAKCCYDASCRAVFEYWKFSNSEEWKEMVRKELEKEKKT